MKQEKIDEIIASISEKKSDISTKFIEYFKKILQNISNEPNDIIYNDDSIEFNWNQEHLRYNFQCLQIIFYYDGTVSCIVQSSLIKIIDDLQNSLVIIEQAVRK